MLLTTRTVRELGQATRNPVLVAAANQVRDGLRGPLGARAQRRPRALARGRDGRARCPPARAPRTPFNAAITAHRRFAFRSTSLDAVKDIKNALGATVNDVVMAVCAGGLRTWLETPRRAARRAARRHGAGVDPHRRGDREVDEPGVGHLRRRCRPTSPTRCERVARVHEAMVDAKELFDAVPAEALTDFAQFPPPAVFARAMRTATRLSDAVRARR